jgi:hypothetical protein
LYLKAHGRGIIHHFEPVELFNKDCLKTATMQKAISDFRVAYIWPLILYDLTELGFEPLIKPAMWVCENKERRTVSRRVLTSESETLTEVPHDTPTAGSDAEPLEEQQPGLLVPAICPIFQNLNIQPIRRKIDLILHSSTPKF